MSDVPAAAFWALATWKALDASRWSTVVAGVAAAIAILDSTESRAARRSARCMDAVAASATTPFAIGFARSSSSRSGRASRVWRSPGSTRRCSVRRSRPDTAPPDSSSRSRMCWTNVTAVRRLARRDADAARVRRPARADRSRIASLAVVRVARRGAVLLAAIAIVCLRDIRLLHAVRCVVVPAVAPARVAGAVHRDRGADRGLVRLRRHARTRRRGQSRSSALGLYTAFVASRLTCFPTTKASAATPRSPSSCSRRPSRRASSWPRSTPARFATTPAATRCGSTCWMRPGSIARSPG